MTETKEYSPGVKYAVSKSVFHQKKAGRMELWDYSDRVASFPIANLTDGDLEAIKDWTEEAEVKND